MTGGYDIEDLWQSPQSEKAPERVVVFSFLFGVHRLERAAAPIGLYLPLAVLPQRDETKMGRRMEGRKKPGLKLLKLTLTNFASFTDRCFFYLGHAKGTRNDRRVCTFSLH